MVYELHIGTFTPEGTFAAAADRLPELAALGVTALQLMPLGGISGRAQLGIRRRAAVRAGGLLWHTGGVEGFRRSAPTAWD